MSFSLSGLYDLLLKIDVTMGHICLREFGKRKLHPTRAEFLLRLSIVDRANELARTLGANRAMALQVCILVSWVKVDEHSVQKLQTFPRLAVRLVEKQGNVRSTSTAAQRG